MRKTALMASLGAQERPAAAFGGVLITRVCFRAHIARLGACACPRLPAHAAGSEMGISPMSVRWVETKKGLWRVAQHEEPMICPRDSHCLARRHLRPHTGARVARDGLEHGDDKVHQCYPRSLHDPPTVLGSTQRPPHSGHADRHRQGVLQRQDV